MSELRHSPDDISDYSNWRIGLSCAASWSWGVSIAVAIAILHTKGVAPFVVWVIGNILALPLFGLVHAYLPSSKHWTRFTPILLLFFVVEYFAITLNLQAIRSVLGGDLDIPSFPMVSGNYATVSVVAIGLVIVAAIQKWGLRGSVLTDVGQYSVQVVSTVALAVMCLWSGEQHQFVFWTDSGRDWLTVGFLGIFTGALGTGHQWQRFQLTSGRQSLWVGTWAGFFFAVYMCFVCIIGVFLTDSPMAGFLFLIIVLAVATSTLDSAVSGLQYLSMRFGLTRAFGTTVAAAAVVLWPFVVSSGLTEIWTIMAKIRYPTVLVALGVTLIYQVSISPRTERLFTKLGIMLPTEREE